MVPYPLLSICFPIADTGPVLLVLLEMCVCSSLSRSPHHGTETPQPTPRNQCEGGDGRELSDRDLRAGTVAGWVPRNLREPPGISGLDVGGGQGQQVGHQALGSLAAPWGPLPPSLFLVGGEFEKRNVHFPSTGSSFSFACSVGPPLPYPRVHPPHPPPPPVPTGSLA